MPHCFRLSPSRLHALAPAAFASLAALAMLTAALPAPAQAQTQVQAQARAPAEEVEIVFMAPDKSADAPSMPAYRRIADEASLARYRAWAANPSARMALALYRRALEIAGQAGPGQPAPRFHVAVVEGGNHPAFGYRLHDGAWQERPQGIYIKLDPNERSFNGTLLHETGHIVLAILNHGAGTPARDLAAIPHTTAALTDRGTAFNEGFAIHLETLAAHVLDDPMVRATYHHPAVLAGQAAKRQAEYYRISIDLLTFAQSRARYYNVRENHYAFAPAYKGPDYLRWQLDPARDFASLRDANQLLQAEGFYATFFYSLLMRGSGVDAATLQARQGQMLETLGAMFKAEKTDGDTPYLTRFLRAYMARYPAEAREVAELFLDLTHGVFMDAQAARLWAAHYAGALRLDLAERDNPAIEKARAAWIERLLADPRASEALLAPQVGVQVPAVKVLLVAFGEAVPLSFDANTVDENIIAGLPHVSPAEVKRWMAQRAQAPFRSRDDLVRRVGLGKRAAAALKAMP